MGKSGLSYARLATVGLGVLSGHAKDFSKVNRDQLPCEVAKDLMCGLDRLMEGGFYSNLKNLLALSREAT